MIRLVAPGRLCLLDSLALFAPPTRGTLQLNARPLFGDPLNETLRLDTDVGILGIEFHSRRRNRMTGKIVSVRDDVVEVRVAQSFGNCPQYIQAREYEFTSAIGSVREALPVERLTELGTAEQAIISQADNFYIASQFSEDQTQVSHGIDVSHRGGKPGFVRMDNPQTLTWPDFVGNFHFNTLGNILLQPRVGLLFIDFNSQDLLYLTGSAEIIWDGEGASGFHGGATPAAVFDARSPSGWLEHYPYSGASTSIRQALNRRDPGKKWRPWLLLGLRGIATGDYEVTQVEQESATIASFLLRA